MSEALAGYTAMALASLALVGVDASAIAVLGFGFASGLFVTSVAPEGDT